MIRKKIKRVVLFTALSIFWLSGRGQNNSKLIQFSGLVLTADSINPIAFAAIAVKGKHYGDYSDLDGSFSFVASKGDTIMFSHPTYQRSYFAIPDTLKSHKYSIVKLLTHDTINLAVTVIKAFPQREAFDYVFVHTEVPDDMWDRAMKNLEREELKERAEAMGMDAQESYRNYMRQQSEKAYYAGQAPPINLLNPIAWAKFFEAWKRGDFKKKK